MRRLALLALCLALAACVTSRVALLPGENGASAGGVVVLDPKTGAEQGQLTEANTEARVGEGPVRPHALTRNFDALLAAMPAPPKVFVLFFVEGTTQLMPESLPTLEALRQAVTPVSDVQITGHTDTVGDDADNDKLSLARAIDVRAALVQEGLPVSNARATGRGSRDLRVPTGPGVAEPANRYVEVIVR